MQLVESESLPKVFKKKKNIDELLKIGKFSGMLFLNRYIIIR